MTRIAIDSARTCATLPGDMNNQEVIFGDPWLQQADPDTNVPKGVRLVCAYDLFLGVEDVIEAAFLRRTETEDELWVLKDVHVGRIEEITGGPLPRGTAGAMGCVLVVQRADEELPDCLNLLELLFRTYHGFCWPTGFDTPGIVNEWGYNELVGRLEAGYGANRSLALKNETDIIRVARELKLQPEPTGEGRDSWQARCPETKHPIYIHAPVNEWFCGWCSRKGGIAELRAFVEERKQ